MVRSTTFWTRLVRDCFLWSCAPWRDEKRKFMKLKILRLLPLVASTFLGRCNVLVAAQARCGIARMSGTGLTDNLQLGSREAEPGQTQLRIEAGACLTFTGQIYAYIRTHSLSLSRALSLTHSLSLSLTPNIMNTFVTHSSTFSNAETIPHKYTDYVTCSQ